ncbi:helix-turn-helix domain-containing protein [Pedobacter psychroterrae]|uniref:XRE family transcriptional regulator n=1 Tax=Pedobacter psychroterrae TaxID=2530453 RepID=A0A4R0NUN7_9SPHI|nr:helix-turn-helix transcriptional regulator [Pedobacter psychroterrae]TCD03205.1 XRE family transcriptional regulator [Pedobacter psychroterrae]
MANQFGTKIKQLREANHLFQREIASALNTDTPMLSKIERGERKAKKEQVPLFEKILKVKKHELLTLWLADQVLELVSNEPVALKAIDLAQREIKGLTLNRS